MSLKFRIKTIKVASCLFFACMLMIALLGLHTKQCLAQSTRTRPGILRPYSATVDSYNAIFVIPISKKKRWDWNLSKTPRESQEYEWAIDVKNGRNKYKVGFFLYKLLSAVPKRGGIKQLLEAGQIAIWKIDADDEGEARLVTQRGLKVILLPDRILLNVYGRRNIKLLFSTKPATVSYSIFFPGRSQCIKFSKVNYIISNNK
jgi:hypothetical protein